MTNEEKDSLDIIKKIQKKFPKQKEGDLKKERDNSLYNRVM